MKSTEESACLGTYRPGPEGSPFGKDRLPGMNSLLRPPTFIVAMPSSSPATICTTIPVVFMTLAKSVHDPGSSQTPVSWHQG